MASWYDNILNPSNMIPSQVQPNWMKQLIGIGNPSSPDFLNVGKGIGNITDTLGITDTGAQQRGLDTLYGKMGEANQALDTGMQPVFDMYGNAMGGRDMGTVLDQFNTDMAGTANAGSADNVQKFMSPVYEQTIRDATNGALAGAGGSLQSSAANKAVGNAVGKQVQSMWQQAFNNAMADAQNRQGVAGQQMSANLMPSLNWAQLTSDVAGSKYDAATSLANSAAQTMGQNQGWFSSLFNGIF